ncbi:hypothetical protein AM500_15980 [Bacillus sp. FJAT-18017]|uniref:YhcN/YlaJ family sporulation lipoprotein n=1 Tax=Bacillus sp. FJAT-18017 TaxID=1705566 RepID=UPI0006AF1BB1|nr:YhcN/YlaJ family sporulation lipoprotein [Bacillus sp. FJAT-18017]ALC91127.1 hypothetical protein AM500_15980 [Bacillus sp. FJAT-18017]
MRNFTLLAVLLFLISGCGANGQSAQNQKNNNENQVKVQRVETTETDRETGKLAARRLEKLAAAVPEVNGANAVVLGRYAIVGIDINAGVERSEAGVIKYSVAEALKDDPHGARAMVVADPDMNARLKEISADIDAGRPIQGIMYELADIAGRLVPEVPARHPQPEIGNEVDEPKNQLNSNERKKLEQKQEEESNYQK